MRERTTWNRDMIRQAASNKTADPYTMNQDHVNQQPKADDYVTGTPSDFAEDVTKENRWETEYSGGAVKRDEIGMPEKRPETYNHPEKTASEAVLLKKAELSVKVARMMLPKNADQSMIEDQGYALMYMPDAELINTFDRLANESEFPGGQFPTAQGQPQEAPPAQQEIQAQPQQEIQAQPQQTQAQLQDMVSQLVQQAIQQQSCSKMAAEDEKKQAEQDEKKQAEQDEKKQQEAKQASQPQISSDQIAQLVQQAVQQALAQGQQPQQPAPQQAQIQPPAQVEPTAGQDDTAMLDAMLMDMDQAPVMEDMGIEMETPMMDTGDVVLGPEDDVLRTLFANQETEDAEKAQQVQEGGQDQGQKQAMNRTASTRTVGTRPTQGVSRVGGAAAPAAANGGEVNKLAALWPSAPDVSEAFGINR